MTLSRLIKVAFALAIAGGLAYAGYRFYPRGRTEDARPLGAVERRDLTLKVTIAGGVVPRRMATITAPYNGYIKKIFVKVGDDIKSGSPVVSVAQTIGVTEDEVFPLRTPIAGRVVQVSKDEGEYVQQNNSEAGGIVRIDDLTKLFVEASVPEIDVAKLKVGLPVVIRAVALPDRVFDGKIIDIARAASTQNQWERSKVEFAIRVEIGNPDGDLRSGMSAVLDVIVQEAKNALSLPHEYVRKDGKVYFVTTADGLRKDVEVGMQNEEAFEIKSGLTEGERVRQVDFLEAVDAGPGGGSGPMTKGKR